MHVIGTAGHVDHGKSALVTALTGTNPDRLAEERERGMTLDLGFAHLQFPDGIEGGIVDVPGHERFLHNMLAGAAGMEILLLVVDAAEGVRAQTLEHLAILRYLNVRQTIVAVSKIDLIDPAHRDRACAQIRRQLKGTIAEGAPCLAVSAATGENVAALKAALHDALAQMPPRDDDAPAYLPIDRAFSLPGLGTVVTGTLMQGSIAAGESLRVEPGGHAAHVRSIGVFGSVRQRVTAGARVALSLPGVDRNDVARGQAVVGKEIAAGADFAVSFTPAPGVAAIMRRRTPVRAYVGSSESFGVLVAGEPAAAGAPYADGVAARARLHLGEPVVAFAGVRFVLRRPSPMVLLGGGTIEGRGEVDADAEAGANVACNREDAALARILRERGLEPATVLELCSVANLREAVAQDALARLVERGDAVALDKPRGYIAAAAAHGLLTRVLAHLERAQQSEPWAMGTTSLALSRALGVPEPLLLRVMETFASQGRLANRQGYYATGEYQPELTLEQRAFFDQLVPLDEGQAFVPIPFAGVAAVVKVSRVVGIGKAFDTMLARGTLVKVGDDLYRGAQIGRIVARVRAHFEKNSTLTASQFRDLLGSSRKYAVPLLEWLDAHGVTIRNGDVRTLRQNA
ncbi:MAG TPA: selenocysteine-specific translation elongation factor [Candidatus Cybelea sp.]|jgi:selenocysteine-specific elongation factor|nr:selenocysteine-specific translation elongation factor [Candidatus Cybelea sp.]